MRIKAMILAGALLLAASPGCVSRPLPEPEPEVSEESRAQLRLELARLEHGDPAVRLRALARLRPFRDPTVVTALVRCLRDADWRVRMNAANDLGRRHASLAVSDLRRLLTDQNPYVRLFAAGALYRLGDQDSLALVLNALRDETTRDEMLPVNQLALLLLGAEDLTLPERPDLLEAVRPFLARGEPGVVQRAERVLLRAGRPGALLLLQERDRDPTFRESPQRQQAVLQLCLTPDPRDLPLLQTLYREEVRRGMTPSVARQQRLLVDFLAEALHRLGAPPQ